MFALIAKKAKLPNPLSTLRRAWLRWKATRTFYRFTADDSGRQYLYEFTFVPRDEVDRWSMQISCVDFARQRAALVERTVSDCEMRRLIKSMIEM